MKIKFMYVIIFCAIALCLIFLSTLDSTTITIEKKEYKKVNDNIYYLDELIVEKCKDKKELLEVLDLISKKFEIRSSSSIYLSNMNYYELNNEIYLNFYQIIDDVVINDTMFTLIVKNGALEEEISTATLKNITLDLNDLADEEVLIKKAYNTFRVNKDKILTLHNYKELKAIYSLERENNGRLAFVFRANNGSFIKFDAKTGELYDSYFDNGIRTGI